ncbi:MAG: ABC-type branched-subunit amino acid transport system substrate-binding protein [Bacteroidia bacterium]|jgi:ABC-type branched-subunit amino acid transport system substrate-binding protein
MTSVQNRLPLLSGNKVLAILSALVLLSCNAFKVVSRDEPVVRNEEKVKEKKEVKTTDNQDDPVEEQKKKRITVDFFGKEFQVEPHRTEFKVALILPFYYNAIDARERRTADYMLEYYQGVKLALNNLEMYGLKMKLYVYDDENDEAKLEGLLGKSLMKSMDVIIGSVGEKQIELVSDFGLEHEIPVISPMTSLDSITTPNALLYCPTPGLVDKSNSVLAFLKENYAKNSVVVVSDGQAYSEEFKSNYMAGFKEEKRKAVAYETPEYNEWVNILSKDEPTVVVVLSRNPTTVSTTLSKIYQTKRDVVIIGDNSWSNFQDNDYKFWDKMNVHLVASDYVNDTSADVKNFKINFRLVNRRDPGVYAFIGYDQFMFMGEFLLAFGEHFPGYINDREFRYLSSNFNYTYKDGLNKNTNVFILKFDEFELKPIE